LRVLVAEDDQRTADYLVRGLTQSGHIVDRVADGETALAMVLEGIYDALVLDRKLPGIDGITLVRRLRRRDRRGGCLVLMLSGIATTADRVEGLRAGCDDYMAKPYSFGELLARLEALGRRSDRSRQPGHSSGRGPLARHRIAYCLASRSGDRAATPRVPPA
jgi:two-component system OmpR family response regulator